MKQYALRSTFLLWTSCLIGCNSPSNHHEENFRATPTSQIGFYVENGSETQPATDLCIEWDGKIIAQDTFRYKGISDSFDYFSLKSQLGEHRIRVTNRENNLVRDTVIAVQDSITNVFVSFVYTELDSTVINRIKKRNPPEGVDMVVEALSEPKRLVIFVMNGPISIP